MAQLIDPNQIDPVDNAGNVVGAGTYALEVADGMTKGLIVAPTGGGGGGGAPSYLGTNSVGGSTENITFGRQYAKKITAPSAGAVLHSVQAYLNQASNSSYTMKGLVWADSAGAPSLLLASCFLTDVVIGAAGWRAFPVGIELAASTAYWIGFVVSARVVGSGAITLAYATGGTDRYQQSTSASQIGDWTSAWSPVTTTNNYSIRGLIT
jgi:hypothetical protein